MKIAPYEIQQKQFRVRFRGLDVNKVNSFLELVRQEFEKLQDENALIKEQLARSDEKLREYKQIENSLRETVVTAQQMVQDYKANAVREAESILKEADIRTDNMLGDAMEKAVKVHEDIVELKGARKLFKDEVKMLVRSHMKMLDSSRENMG